LGCRFFDVEQDQKARADENSSHTKQTGGGIQFSAHGLSFRIMTLTQPDSQTSVFLSRGFRPFFLGAGIWALLAMLLWLAMLRGAVPFAVPFDPVSWHAHAFLFGFVSAVVAGFLLTAVPNWTGRPALAGWPLMALGLWWLVGRALTTIAGLVPPWVALTIDVSFLVVLASFMARELILSGNHRNLIVVGAILLLAAANAVFHLEAMTGEAAYQGNGLRLGVSATLLLIMIVGGRIVPNFTRNWLKQRGAVAMPAAAMQRFDQVTLLVSFVALLSWTFAPQAMLSGLLLLVMAALNAVRLARWRGLQTLSEPLIAVLHIAYALVPVGGAFIALAILLERPDLARGAQHIWMAGAIGLMCLAVMTRASLGHSGRPLTAGRGTLILYGAVVSAVLVRLAAAIMPAEAPLLWSVSGGLWLIGFGLFVVLYGPMMLKARG
jgi:uncharacterized protein involved in response to NO